MRASSALDDANEAMRLADLDPGRAVPAAERAARRARRERDPTARAVAERAWGHALVYCGDFDGATRHLRRSMACGNEAGSAALVGEARMKLAYVLIQQGRLPTALREVDAALHVLDGAAGARARATRAFILHQTDRLQEALTEFQIALSGHRRAADTLAVQRTLTNRALVHIDLHAFAAAEADLVEAGRLAEELDLTVCIGIVEENRGVLEGLRGDVPAALAKFDSAERIIAGYAALLGPMYRIRAELLLSVGLFSEARAAAERALVACRRERRLLNIPEVRLLLAQTALLDGDPPTALRQARSAMREFARQQRGEWVELARLSVLQAQLASGHDPRISAGALAAFVHTLSRTGWPAAALEARLIAARLAARRGRQDAERDLLREASRAVRCRGPAALRSRGRYAQALLRLSRGDRRGAAAAARAGLQVLDDQSAAMGAADLRAHAAVYRRDLTELGLRIALEDGRLGRVFEWAERGRANQLRYRPARPPHDPELASLLSELRLTTGEIDRSRDAGRGVSRLVQRQVELERQIRDHSRRRRGALDALAADPVTVDRLSAALGEWGLVEFVALDGVLHGLCLARGRLRLQRLESVAVLADLVDRLPYALHRLARLGAREHSATASGVSATAAAALALLEGAASRLDAALLRPFAAELSDRPLVLVPTGPLHSMPWSILPSCSGRPLVVSPSATLWHATATRALDPSPASVAVAAGPKLRGAREEAHAVAAIHDTSALVDAAATVDAVLTALGSADLVHLAAHGRLCADNPLFSDLLLADGRLVVYDLEQLPRVPHTVVLAACDSGRSAVRAGDELLGLSATFLARGAAQLIASALPIPDAETAPLMAAFHDRLAGGDTPAVALAGAQRQFSGAGGRNLAALAAAAGFVCIGSGAQPLSRRGPVLGRPTASVPAAAVFSSATRHSLLS